MTIELYFEQFAGDVPDDDPDEEAFLQEIAKRWKSMQGDLDDPEVNAKLLEKLRTDPDIFELYGDTMK